MSSEHHERLRELFLRVCELGFEERSAWLNEACAGDADLRAELESLLARDERPMPGLKTGGAAAGAASSRGTEPVKTSEESLSATRFVPGMFLDRRYRIVGLLGRGGMGEVYRADDLKLGQVVALKFLPPGLERDERRLRRLVNEVKLARQVTHGNVCRIYDLGEVAGQHFISMEYVDGEDLASLLRRIGRLPRDKAVQIAHQLCAGLAAMHRQGILHRDIKPENVMIDGRGRVRITDFGLAAGAEGIEGSEIRAGTPRYMSPEQRAGEEVTVQSDLFSLGLLLYELFTGHMAYPATDVSQLSRLQEERPPTLPSSLVDGLPEEIDSLILRCLDTAPGKRPKSALAVGAELPGGDPIAAALAAGETPSPEVVAAAGGSGVLKPAVATPLLTFVLVGLTAMAAVNKPLQSQGLAPLLKKPPEALAVEAREIIRLADHGESPLDSAYGYEYDWDLLHQVVDPDAAPVPGQEMASLRPGSILFWYRESPRYLVPTGDSISLDSPPSLVSGMASVRLDPEGRLKQLTVTPPQFDPSEGPWPDLDWSRLFEKANLDVGSLAPATPSWTATSACDQRRAWLGVTIDQPAVPIRVEAASYKGKPVYFEVVPPWRRPGRMEQNEADPRALVFYFALPLAAALLARRNLRLGRGDRRGALRLAWFVFFLGILYWILTAHHVPTAGEAGWFALSVAESLYFAVYVGLIYLAVEPWVRRFWPDTLVSWSRVLAGRLRDPRVGRDVLVGAAAGVAIPLCGAAVITLLDSQPDPAPSLTLPLDTLLGTRQALGTLLDILRSGVFWTAVMLLFLSLSRAILRRRWVAVVATFLIEVVIWQPWKVFGSPAAGWLFLGIVTALQLFILIRFGFVALISTVSFSWLNLTPVWTSDFSTWYVGLSVLYFVLFAAIAVGAFLISLGGRPLLAQEWSSRT